MEPIIEDNVSFIKILVSIIKTKKENKKRMQNSLTINHQPLTIN